MTLDERGTGVSLDAKAVDRLVDRLYTAGWNAALDRIAREIEGTIAGSRSREARAPVLALVLNLRRPDVGSRAVVDHDT